MNKDEIRLAAEQLSLELLKLDPDETEKRAEIEALQAHLQQVMDDTDTKDKKEIGASLTDSISAFEVSHPELASMINQLAHLLSNMGI